MKKCLAILLLGVMCFNWGGYQAVVAWLSHQADANMQHAIDGGHYNQQQLVELRVNIDALPYTPSYQDWEWVEGELLIEGVYHRYVQRKFDAGQMVLRCLPNMEKGRVEAVQQNLIQDLHDQHALEGGKQPSQRLHYISNYIGDYDDLTHGWLLQHPAPRKAVLAGQTNAAPLPTNPFGNLFRPPIA